MLYSFYNTTFPTDGLRFYLRQGARVSPHSRLSDSKTNEPIFSGLERTESREGSADFISISPASRDMAFGVGENIAHVEIRCLF